MSKQIDERIVSLGFDNSDFMDKANATINRLKDLEQSLAFKDGTRGLENVQAAGRNFNMDGMSNSIQNVIGHFSALEIAGITAIQNLTNKAIDYGERLVKSLSVDQISAGWEKFGQKTTSVATLVSQGYELEDVNEQLKRLNWFTDETSYNFTDMVGNIGKFTASGQKLDESVTAMEGIALWAALSGQNATTASRAMYQLSQAMSKGALRYDDYKSIQNANMDTKEFRENAVKAAEAMNVLKKNADGTYRVLSENKDFTLAELFSSDALTRTQWFNKDVMMDVFNQYSGAVEQLYQAVDSGRFDTASEAIAGMQDELDGFQLKAFKAGQEARTFRDVIDSVKDAVSTGWMNTFEYLVGDYEEATAFWTDMANRLWDVFASGAERRNAILEEWKDLGGRDDLIRSFWNIWDTVDQVASLIKESFREIFPSSTAKNLLDMTESLKAFTGRLLALFKLPERYDEFVEKGIFSDEELEHFSKVQERIDKIRKTFEGLFAVFDIMKQAVSAVVKSFGKFLSYILPAGDGILDLTSNLGDYLVNLDETIKENDTFNKLLERLDPLFKAIGGVIKPVFSFLTKALNTVLGLLDPITKKVDEFGNTTEKKFSILGLLINGISKAFEFIGNFIDMIKPALANLGEGLKNVWASIKDGLSSAFENFDFSAIIGVILAGLTGSILKNLSSFTYNISSLLDGIVDALGAWTKNNLADVFLKIAESIAILAGSLFLLSTIDSKKIYTSIAAIGALATVLVLVMKAVDKLSAVGGISKDGDNPFQKFMNGITSGVGEITKSLRIQSLAKSLLYIAGSIGILAVSMRVLAGLEWDQILKGGVALASLATILVATEYALSKVKGVIAKGGATFIGIATGLLIMAGAVAIFGKMDPNNLALGIFAIGAIMAEFAIFSHALKPKGILKAAVAMTVMSGAALIMSAAIFALGHMNSESLGIGLVALAAGVTALALAANAMKGTLLGSASMLIMSVAITTLAVALKILGTLSWEGLAKGIVAIASSLLLLGLAGVTLAPIIPAMLGLSAAFLLFGVAAIALGAGITAISGAFAALSVSLEVSLPAIINAVKLLVLGIVNAIDEIIPRVIEVGIKLIIGLLATITANIGQFVTLGVNLVVNFIKGVTAMLPIIIETAYLFVVAVINGIADAIRNGAPLIYLAIGNTLDAIWDMIIETIALALDSIPGIGKKAGDLIRGAKDWIVPAVEDTMTTVGTTVEDGYSHASGKIEEGTEKVNQSFNEFDDNLANHASSISNTTDTLTKIMNGDFSDLGYNVEDVMGNIVDITDISDQLGANMSGNMESFNNAFTTGADQTVETSETMVENTEKPVINLEQRMPSHGKNITSGLANGIAEGADAVVNEVATLVSRMNTEWQKLQDEHSPSRVWFDFGKFLMIGLANGVNKFADTAVKATVTTADDINSSMTNLVSEIATTLNGDLDTAPTIRPVIDTSGIESGTSLINSMMQNQNGSLYVGNVVTKDMRVAKQINDTMDARIGELKDLMNVHYSEDQNATIVVPVSIDGRETARVIAPYARSELNRLDRNENRRNGRL